MDTPIEKLIERIEGETPNEYSAFLAFAQLPPSQRIGADMMKYVAENSMLVAAQIPHIRSKNQWHERANQIDAHNWMVDHQKREKLREADNEKFIAESRLIQEKALKLSDQMMDVAGHLLTSAKLIDKTIETGHVTTKDGRKVPTVTTVHMKSKVSDIPRLAEVGMKMARLAADLPTEIIETDLAAGADLSNLSDEELIALREKNHRTLLEKSGILKSNTPTDETPLIG